MNLRLLRFTLVLFAFLLLGAGTLPILAHPAPHPAAPAEDVPIAELQITGPLSGTINQVYTFTASIAPISATTPITYLWEATGHPIQTTSTGTLRLLWRTAGLQTITVTASNSATITPTVQVKTIYINPAYPTGTVLVGGKLVDNYGTPVVSATLWLYPDGGGPGKRLTQTDATGHYTFVNLLPGRYVISATRLGYIPAVHVPITIGIIGNAPYPFMLDQSLSKRDAYYLTKITYNGTTKEPATDSASAATAMACGYKTDDGNIAWLPGDPVTGSLTTIAERLRINLGFAIGAASTVPFSHATPASFISHNVHRDNYHAIAREIIFTTTPELVIGGGYYPSITTYISQTEYLSLTTGSTVFTYVGRQAGVDGAVSLSTTAASVNFNTGGKLFGLFGGSGGNFEYFNVADAPGAPAVTRAVTENPTLPDIVNASLPLLSQDPQGFFVLFEQGDIDWSNHKNNYATMIGGVWDLDRAVRTAEAYIDQPGGIEWADTLVIVTADHSTGHLRLLTPLGMGDLPQQVWTDADGDGVVDDGEWGYPNNEIRYGSINHINELVDLQARGKGADLFEQYVGELYPNTRIVNNIRIYDVMRRAAEEAGAKHIILFVGDGMSIASETGASRYLYGTDDGLAWHHWSERSDGWNGYVATWDVTAYNKYAQVKNLPAYSINNLDPMIGYDLAISGPAPYPRQPEYTANEGARSAYYLTKITYNGATKEPATDSASAATAMACGYKTDDGNIAWLPGDPVTGSLTTIAERLRINLGFAIGAASTVPFSHATPASFISHNVHRDNYHAIAREIIFTTTPELVIGGGYYPSITTYISQTEYLSLTTGSTVFTYVGRQAGVDGAVSLSTTAASVNFNTGGKLFGLFGGSGGNFEYFNVADAPGAPAVTRAVTENPTLPDIVNASLPLLSQDPQGFFVLFEQGDIDWSNHKNNYATMIGGVWDLDRAVRTAEAYIDQPGGIEWADTLVIVTADHSTGHLRLLTPLGMGDLPQQVWTDADGDGVVDDGEWGYPNNEIRYGSINHINELVDLQARGKGADLFEQYVGELYPNTRIVNNIRIYDVMRRAAEEAGAKHIILFVGDGMSIASETGASRYLYGTDDGLAWHHWSERSDGWNGYVATWDVTAYNKYALVRELPAYTPTGFDPLVGFNPGGIRITNLNMVMDRRWIFLPLVFRNNR